MPKITFVDAAGTVRTVEGETGATVMETAIRNNIPGIEAAKPCPPHRDVAEPARQHILDDREALNQIVFLKHHSDMAAHLAKRAAAELGDVLAAKQDFA